MTIETLMLLASLALVGIITNRILAIPQQVKMNQQLVQIKKSGPACSVGLRRSLMGSKVGIIVVELNGEIIKTYKTGGYTIFSTRFIEDQHFEFTNYHQVIEVYGTKEKLSKQQQAYLMAAEYLAKGLQ